MKTVLLTLLLLFISQGAYAQVFTIDDKGIVKCPTAKNGDIGTIFGVTYEAVNITLLKQRRDESADLTKLCTSLVTDMRALFYDRTFNQPIGSWDVSRVTNMSDMFGRSTFNQPIGNWDVSSVTDMRSMFAHSLFDQDINNWDVGNVTRMTGMFSSSVFNKDLDKWNVGNVTDMYMMFNRALFNQPINSWDVSKVTTMLTMFRNSQFDRPLDNWDVRNVKLMRSMFEGSPFNQSIGNWDVSTVIDMTYMFSSSMFNQNLNQWCVNKHETEPIGFSNGSPLTTQNKPVWGTCPGLPGISSLLSPQSNLVDASPIQTFIWNPIENSSIYQLQLYEEFDPKVLDTLVKGTQLALMKALKTGTVHNWRVRGINEARKLTGEWSPIWRFTTLSVPTPSLLAPANNATGLSGAVQLNWNTTANTPDYQLQVSTSNTFATLRLNSTVSAPPFSLAAFQPGDPASFFWRVRSNSEFGPGAWSNVWTFTRAKLTSTGDDAEVPAEYSLSQNFPNPFNPTTQISFTLPRSASVRLEVFNSLGQPVGVIAEGQLAAGAHTYAFDGAALSSGVYLYRLTTPDFVQTRVMALVK